MSHLPSSEGLKQARLNPTMIYTFDHRNLYMFTMTMIIHFLIMRSTTNLLFKMSLRHKRPVWLPFVLYLLINESHGKDST